MNFYSIRQITLPAIGAVVLCSAAWSVAANAAQVRAPARPVASKAVVLQPGEPYEVRTRRARKHNERLDRARDYLLDDSIPGRTAAPAAAQPIPVADQTPDRPADPR